MGLIDRRRSLRKYSQAEIAGFESQMGIILPKDYSDYLIRVGSGHYTISKVDYLENWCQPEDPSNLPPDFLQREFPHTSAWSETQLFVKAKGWNSEYFGKRHIQGSMRIVNYGCEGYYLLVVTGPERGNMWFDDRACHGTGITPLCNRFGLRVSFAEFLVLSDDKGRMPKH